MSTVISPTTGKLIKVGSKEFETLVNDPKYSRHFTYPSNSDARIVPVVPYVPPSTPLPPVPSNLSSLPSLTSLPSVPSIPVTNSYPRVSNLPSVPSLSSLSSLSSIPSNLYSESSLSSLPSVPSNSLSSLPSVPSNDLMMEKFGNNNRSYSNTKTKKSPIKSSKSQKSKILNNSSESIPDSLIVPLQYPSEKVDLTATSVPIEYVWPSLSNVGCKNCYYHP